MKADAEFPISRESRSLVRDIQRIVKRRVETGEETLSRLNCDKLKLFTHFKFILLTLREDLKVLRQEYRVESIILRIRIEQAEVPAERSKNAVKPYKMPEREPCTVPDEHMKISAETSRKIK